MVSQSVNKGGIINLRGVTHRFSTGNYQVEAIKDISLSIKTNSFNIIFGPSGSGKSTLLNIIAGLQAPTTGEVEIEGKNLYAKSQDELAYFRASRIGFMHQTNHWIKSLNVLDNVSMPLFFLGYSRDKATRLAEIALDRVGMRSYAHKYPVMLSGGEQQRVGAARALANDPLFIIADEPTGNLDTANGDMIMSLLLNAQAEFRRTIIIVTHNLEYIPLADNLIKMHDGAAEGVSEKSINKVASRLMGDTKTRMANLSKSKGTML